MRRHRRPHRSGPRDATRDDDTGQVTEAATIDIRSLRVGDCMLEGNSGALTEVDVVPCAEKHDGEVFYAITMDNGDYSSATISERSQECIGEPFASFVGVEVRDSDLAVYPITPTAKTWKQLDDRTIQCVITDPAGQNTGSLRGAAR